MTSLWSFAVDLSQPRAPIWFSSTCAIVHNCCREGYAKFDATICSNFRYSRIQGGGAFRPSPTKRRIRTCLSSEPNSYKLLTDSLFISSTQSINISRPNSTASSCRHPRFPVLPVLQRHVRNSWFRVQWPAGTHLGSCWASRYGQFRHPSDDFRRFFHNSFRLTSHLSRTTTI